MASTSVTWKCVSPGVYDSADGRYEMYRIEGVSPPAWNVDYSPTYAAECIDADPEHLTTGDFDTIVDGARTKADAIWAFEQEVAAGRVRGASPRVYAFRSGSPDYPSGVAGPFASRAEARAEADKRREMYGEVGRIQAVTQEEFEEVRAKFAQGIRPRGF